jgi:hypothetical protein
MKAIAKTRQALRNVIRFRRRSFFMMLGIIVGITSLTVLNSIGENTRRETMARVRNMLGTFDTVIIRPGGGKTRGMVSLVNVEPALKFPDAEAIASEIGEVKQVAKLSERVRSGRQLSGSAGGAGGVRCFRELARSARR